MRLFRWLQERRRRENRREFIRTISMEAPVFVGGTFQARKLLSQSQTEGRSTPRTNVLILLSDQHAHNFLGCANYYAPLRTPTYDKLAADGVRFTQARVAALPCLPSRINLFTGLYPFQTGAFSNRHLIPLEQIPSFSLAPVLREAGFSTAACGKMHMFPYQAAIPEGNYWGFDYRAGHFHETGEKMDTHFVKEHREWKKRYVEEMEHHGVDKGGDGTPSAFIGYVSELTTQQSVDWWVAGKTAEFISSHRNEPFFAVCSVPTPHAPHAVPADLADLYDPEDVPLPAKQ